MTQNTHPGQDIPNASPLHQIIHEWLTPTHIGWVLIFLSTIIGCLSINFGSFVDEADNLSVGWLITQKYVLYRDVFSHHFPFAYYWAAFIIMLFGKSIFVVRLSVWLYQILAFGIAMQLTRYYWSIGLTSIAWSVIHTLYRNNQILYSPFAASAVFVVFILTFRSIYKEFPANKKIAIVQGIFSIIALLSDPLSVYAIGTALVFLLLKNRKQCVYTIIVIILGVFGYIGALYISGSLQGFIQDALIFNATIYAKYINEGPFRFIDLIRYILTAFDITNPIWYNINPFFPINPGYVQVDQWLLTGFLYRFGLITGVIILLLRREFILSIFVYIMSCTVLLINTTGFRSTPFTLLALVLIGMIITNDWHLSSQEINPYILKTLQLCVRAFLWMMLLWLFLRGTQFIYQQGKYQTYNSQFASYEKDAKQIINLTCNNPGVSLIDYPEGLYAYWYTGLKPVSKYMFMFPWVAEVGLTDTINKLKQPDALTIVIYQREKIWNTYDTNVYMRPLLDYLNLNYIKVNENHYISPSLYKVCSGSR